MIITTGLFSAAMARALIMTVGMTGVAVAESTELFIANETAEIRRQLDGHFDHSQAATSLWGFNLPSPLGFTKTYENGAWQVDGVGISTSSDVELRATGQVNSVTNRLEGNLSLRFRF